MRRGCIRRSFDRLIQPSSHFSGSLSVVSRLVDGVQEIGRTRSSDGIRLLIPPPNKTTPAGQEAPTTPQPGTNPQHHPTCGHDINPIVVAVVIAPGKRPVPFRTRKLSLDTAMVLHSPGCGRVGHRRHPLPKEGPHTRGASLFLPPTTTTNTPREPTPNTTGRSLSGWLATPTTTTTKRWSMPSRNPTTRPDGI